MMKNAVDIVDIAEDVKKNNFLNEIDYLKMREIFMRKINIISIIIIIILTFGVITILYLNMKKKRKKQF